MSPNFDIIIIGGGAAGFFAAINIAERFPTKRIAILEKNKTGLQKVKISGGGRCNVTHAEFIPSELVKNYPRGQKELLGPFHKFMTGDTIAWFQERGVELKIEEDGRMFPITNSSQTIIDCFLSQTKKLGVEVFYNSGVTAIETEGNEFKITTSQTQFTSEALVVSTGSSPKFWKILQKLGHKISSPVPSLFTFNVSDNRIKDIPGVVIQDVNIKVLNTNLNSNGPLLITHSGFSAPSILKLSAFGALELAQLEYDFKIEINFINKTIEETTKELENLKIQLGKKQVFSTSQFNLPKRMWQQLVLASDISKTIKWADLNKYQLENLKLQLTQSVFKVDGKSTFKDEFVTAGGVDLKEINFKTFESKLIPNLYLAGEVLNIDAVTGGFNFQNAWTGAYIISQSLDLNVE